MNEKKKVWDNVFFFKVIRNALILSGMYFLSVWATSHITYTTMKPVLLFLGTYVIGELAQFYGLQKAVKEHIKDKEIKRSTFIFT